MVIGILGLGQVGRAIKELFEEKNTVVGRDLNADQFASVSSIDILHICIPYSDTFEETVIQTIDEIHPYLVIIDSTVAPGTTQSIYQKTQVKIAHCPILGKHPNLAPYQKRFLKPVGAIDKFTYTLVEKHFASVKVKTTRFDSPLESELAKILDTTYYAWNILFEKWVHEITTHLGANFSQVYTQFNEIYNAGYTAELPHVRRPVLKHQHGPIGGHCLLPNLLILHAWISKKNAPLSEWTAFMVEKGRKAS